MTNQDTEEKYYQKPLNIIIFGLILIVILISYFSYKDFEKNFEKKAMNIATKANKELEKSMLYTENLANFIANQIIDAKQLTKTEIARILRNTKPRLDKKQDIFSEIFFDFIDPDDKIIVTESKGILEKPFHLEKDKRSWLIDAKITPWKLLPAKKDVGVLTKEVIIPCGFGISKRNGEFVGIITGGINVKKLQEKLNEFSSRNYNMTLIDYDNSIVFTSDSEVTNQEDQIKNAILESQDNAGFIKIDGNKFYYQKTDGYDFKILVGVDKKDYTNQFWEYSLPEILENFYLATFLVIYVYVIVRILFL